MSTTEATPELELQLIGGGRMGEALAGGLLEAGFCDAGSMAIVEPDAGRRAELASILPGVVIAESASPATDTVVAVKPGVVSEVLADLAAKSPTRVLSIAAGVRLDTLEAAVGSGVPVIRAMPNTPSLVGQGASAIAGGSHTREVDVAWAQTLLEAVGIVVVVTEAQLDAVTGLSGSGPAYVFLLAEAMIEAGVLQGLSRHVSAALVSQTILGAGTLLTTTGDDPGILRAGVTSPGGTTAAGLASLEHNSFRSALIEAVAAAATRSAELGHS